ncbi:MAG: ATP-binding cassette domain-containing protein, partial [Candidatus Brocadiia bacterium]
MALLTLDGITRRIRGVAALDGVGLVVEAGTVHALLGPDQTAKAALLDILSGAEGADAGRMVLDGEPLEIASTRHARQLGFALVRHGAPLFAPLSVAENVGLAAGLPTRLGGWVRREALRQAARRLLAHAGGGHVPLERRVDGLAPADRLFVALAMALARRPRLLLLDAPGEALDAEAAARLRGALRRMADAGTAVLWATGPPDGAADIADAVTVLADAQVAASGPPAAVPAETAAEDPSEGPPRLRAAGRAPRAERHLRRLRAVAAAVVAAVLLGVLGWRVWGFLGPHNVAKLAFDVAVLALAGTGLTLVMAGGGVDLSLGSVLALAGVCAALAVQAGAPLAAGAAAALA